MSARCQLCLVGRLLSEQFISFQHPSPWDRPGCWEIEVGQQLLWVHGSEDSVGIWGSEKKPTKVPSSMTDRPPEGGLRVQDGAGGHLVAFLF